ncbi:NLI interacting factor-like phosphatase-domain-containing protein [Phascolomyces articulosus]|uniref:NLI interacting factor-like phosphatase-domain-containing protein n=1 Tax=Phascolomyces articulosus TaxID=60185 RepID=A0AAD5KEI2_9FUNG|nr:NLI interacting factor-like phosphatase-domain-containing protein [Phascolomyces articulosus]
MRQRRIESATTATTTTKRSSSSSSNTYATLSAATASLLSNTTSGSSSTTCSLEDKLYSQPQQRRHTSTTTGSSIASHSKKLAALQYYKGKTLVLDLDETLVHSVRLGSYAARQQTVSTSIKRKKIEVQDDKQSMLYEVYKRPHVDFFLKTISQWYKVVIFTASMAEYADPVIDWLDQDHNVISQRYFRQSCIVRNGNFVKDISLAEPDLAKVCLVDNSNAAFGLFQENGIPLPGWISNPNDECLLDLLPLLDALRFTADVRSVLRLRLMGVS